MSANEFCSSRPFIRADLWVHLEDGGLCSATLMNRDGRLVLDVHNVSILAGLCTDPSWRSRALELANRGQAVDICHDGMHLLTLGSAVSDPRVQAGPPCITYGTWPHAATIVAASNA